MSDSAGRVQSRPLCGDLTCRDYACTQEAWDAWVQQGWDAAGEVVAGALGLDYRNGEFVEKP